MTHKHYTVYDNKTDMPVIVDGTRRECEEAMGVTSETFHHYVWQNNTNRKCRWTIVVEEEQELILSPDTLFGGKIRYHRMKMGLSPKDMANKTGIHYQSILSYEVGKTEPTISYAVRIADVLGLSLDYLTGRE